MNRRLMTGAGLALLLCGSAYATDLSITAEPYGMAGLFTRPLIPAERDTVTITVRATVTGEAPEAVDAKLTVIAPDGSITPCPLAMAAQEETFIGSAEWTAADNGLYRVKAVLDPDNAVEEEDEDNNAAELDLPVVIPGRQPHFVWYSLADYLHWANVSGKTGAEAAVRGHERGRTMLQWHSGSCKPGVTEESAYMWFNRRMKKNPVASQYGMAVDELGYYPKPESEKSFREYMSAARRWKKENPGKFLMIWHCGTLYPEQAAGYRGACDLVVIESYVHHWGPAGLGTENYLDVIDMKMVPTRQCDLLVETGRGTQAITSVDLTYPTFHRGMIVKIFRHLRREWPEMRGIGFFGDCTRDAPEDDAAAMVKGVANNKYVDQLCFDYFVRPVVTIQPGNLWVNREDDGSTRITAAVSNIGGMDSGPVTVRLKAGIRRSETIELETVPAGNNLKENQARAEVTWDLGSGRHRISAELEPPQGAMVLDGAAEMIYYAP